MDGTGRVMEAEKAEILATEILFVVVRFRFVVVCSVCVCLCVGG